MKKVLLALLTVSLLGSACFAGMVDSIYASGNRLGIGLMDSMVGIETHLDTYNSSGATSTSNFNLGLRLVWPHAKPCKGVSTGFGLLVDSSSTTTSSAVLGATIFYTVELKVADKLAIFGDVTLLSAPNLNNTSARMDALTSNAQIYTGGRLYL